MSFLYPSDLEIKLLISENPHPDYISDKKFIRKRHCWNKINLNKYLILIINRN